MKLKSKNIEESPKIKAANEKNPLTDAGIVLFQDDD